MQAKLEAAWQGRICVLEDENSSLRKKLDDIANLLRLPPANSVSDAVGTVLESSVLNMSAQALPSSVTGCTLETVSEVGVSNIPTKAPPPCVRDNRVEAVVQVPALNMTVKSPPPCMRQNVNVDVQPLCDSASLSESASPSSCSYGQQQIMLKAPPPSSQAVRSSLHRPPPPPPPDDPGPLQEKPVPKRRPPSFQ